MKLALSLAMGMPLTGAAALAGQNAVDTPDAHVALERTAAGDTYQNLFNFLCSAPVPAAATRRGPPSPGAAADTPALATQKPAWYAEPVKVFDNLYFVGQSEYSAWAVTTSEGIILIDTLFDAGDPEISGGCEGMRHGPTAAAELRWEARCAPDPV